MVGNFCISKRLWKYWCGLFRVLKVKILLFTIILILLKGDNWPLKNRVRLRQSKNIVGEKILSLLLIRNFLGFRGQFLNIYLRLPHNDRLEGFYRASDSSKLRFGLLQILFLLLHLVQYGIHRVLKVVDYHEHEGFIRLLFLLKFRYYVKKSLVFLF